MQISCRAAIVSRFKAPEGYCCQCAYDALPLDEDYSEDYNECLNSDYHDFGVMAFHGMDKAFTYACTREGCDAEISQSEMRTRALFEPEWEPEHVVGRRGLAVSLMLTDATDTQYAPDTRWTDTGIQFSVPDTH